MNLLKMDGPIMNFLRMITNYLILQIIFVISCVPIITIGAAIAAKYQVAMKLVKDEDTGIVKPFFQAFAKNFKEATPIWIGQLVIYFLIYLDWVWMIDQNIKSFPVPYIIAMIIISCVAIAVSMVIFPMLSKFEMTKVKLYKGTITFIFMNLFKLLLIIALNVIALIGALWYFEWLPLIVAFASVAVTYFMATTLNKEFDKVEKKYKEEHPEEFADEESDEREYIFQGERDEKSALDSSYAASRKELGELAKEMENSEDEVKAPENPDSKKKNRITKYYDEERSKLKDMTGKQKWQYFVDYYLAIVVVIILLIGGIAWYVADVIKDTRNVMTGGLVNCAMTEDGKEYVTDGFVQWAGYSKYKTAKLGDTNISFENIEEYNNQMMDAALYAEINAGMFNYFFMDRNAVDLYQEDELFMLLDEFADISKIDKEYLVFNNQNRPIAIKLDDDHKALLGFPKNADIYLGFLFSTDPIVNSKFVDYLYNQ